MSRLAGWTVVAGLVATVSVSAVAPARAALSESSAAPNGRSPSIELAQMPAAPAPNVEANIASLHQRLGITPAQEPQFEAFASVLRQNARMMPSAPSSSLNAVERLRTGIQFAQQDLAGMRRMLPALQALYAVLSPAQKQAADQAFSQGPGG